MNNVLSSMLLIWFHESTVVRSKANELQEG